jgi:hypothetical protein
MSNTELSEFFSLVSEEKNEKIEILKNKIKDPETGLADLFEQLANARKEAIKVSEEISVQIKDEPVVEPESINLIDEQARLGAFSKLINSLKEEPEEVESVVIEHEVEISDALDPVEPLISEAPKNDYIKDIVTQISADTKSKNPRQVDVHEKSITDFKSLQKEFTNFKQKVIEQLGSLGGGGEVNLQFLDDVQSSTAKVDGKVLQYSAADDKWVGGTASVGAPELLEETDGHNIIMDASAASTDVGDDILIESGVDGGRDIDLSVLQSLTSDIIPQQGGKFNLGSPTHRFENLYLGSQTLDIGGAQISSDGSGLITISAGGVTLPAGSKDVDGNVLATQTVAGQTFRAVKLFTQASGLSTAALTMKFNAAMSNKTVYTEAGHVFTLSNGDAKTDTGIELFQF